MIGLIVNRLIVRTRQLLSTPVQELYIVSDVRRLLQKYNFGTFKKKEFSRLFGCLLSNYFSMFLSKAIVQLQNVSLCLTGEFTSFDSFSCQSFFKHYRYYQDTYIHHSHKYLNAET